METTERVGKSVRLEPEKPGVTSEHYGFHLPVLMKKKMTLTLVAVLLLLFTFGLGYWSGFSHARKGAPVVVATDTSDSQQSSGEAGYEPYFTQQNPIPDRAK
ncbi:MAG TPA: hypothetical protein VN673_18550 [Clostridia bacterium]|nr:hypothetical protein [Clostridia bacterium]